MNKARRKILDDIWGKIMEAHDLLDEVKSEEEDVMENIPENLQGSERYEACENAVYEMEECIGYLEDVCDKLNELVEG